MPVESDFFNHEVALAALVGPQEDVVKHDDVQNHAREHVEAVEARDEEKEVCELLLTVFVALHVGTLNHLSSIQ